jgi:pimeloyl-ACP methyl ester carboxylesterase
VHEADAEVREDAGMIVTPPHRDRYVVVDGLRLHVVEYGASEGEPLVLLHGVTGHAAAWSHVASDMSATRRVLVLDLRGAGDTQWSPVHAYATTDHATDVVGVLDALGVARADLVGSSWGALVALAVAARAPARVRRLGLVDIEPSFSQDETDVFPGPRSFASHADVVANERAAKPHADDALLDLVAAGGTRPGPDGTLVPKHDPFFFERWPFRSDDWWDTLPAITAPTLVVHAGASFVRREITEQMARTLPDGRHVEIAGSAHVVPIDAPVPLIAALRDFLQ